MKYFLLSIFSSALLLFGFSYLYGLTGTTNIPAMVEALAAGAVERGRAGPAAGGPGPGRGRPRLPHHGGAFHFYAPDVYQGTPIPGGGPAGVHAQGGRLRRPDAPAGLRPPIGKPLVGHQRQVPVLLWIMAAVTMTLGNVLAFLQNNIKRMLAYSSVAHAGYMLIGLAVGRQLATQRRAVRWAASRRWSST